MKKVNIKIYIVVLVLTLLVFSTAFFVSSYINNKKTEELKANEDKIAVDILSFESQFKVANSSSCQDFDNSNVRNELDTLASKLMFMEGQVGTTDPELFRLKRYYSLLEIRDYLLTKRMSQQCNLNTTFILYFYTDNNQCSSCQTQQYILQALHDEYPQIEIYSFDYDQDLSAVKTLTSISNIPSNPPIIDINNKMYAPFNSLTDIEAVLAPYIASSTASTTTTIAQ